MTDIKNGIHKALTTRLLGVAVAAAALITPSIASAQDVPSYESRRGRRSVKVSNGAN
jgi:hypothetical protein